MNKAQWPSFGVSKIVADSDPDGVYKPPNTTTTSGRKHQYSCTNFSIHESVNT